MAKVKDITKGDLAERYLEFQDTYYDNLVQYAIDVSRYTPTWQQYEVMEAIQEPGSRVAVASGHGTGKSQLASVVIDWHMRVFPFSNTMITATNIDQARGIVFKYLDEILIDADRAFPWMRGFFVKEAKKYFAAPYKSSWFCIAKTASRDRPENLAGMHGTNYLVFADESSGIPDENLSVIRGAFTHERNRFFMASQPTRPVGHFADAMTTLAKKKKEDGRIEGIYDAFTLNSEESPIVSCDYIREKLIELGGHHNPQYQIRVLGRLPDNLSGYLIPKTWCEEAQYITITHEEAFGWVLAVDVAEGVHRDSSVATMAKVSGHGPQRMVECVWTEEFLDKDEKQFARWIASIFRDPAYPGLTITVDGDGAGRTVVLDLEDIGIPTERIHWGLPCHSTADQKRFLNQRAYAHVKLREGIFEKRFKAPINKKFVAQASKLPYKLDERGRYRMMPKDQMKSEGIKSPDISDTCCFFYLTDYIPCEGGARHGTAEDDFLELAKAAIGED